MAPSNDIKDHHSLQKPSRATSTLQPHRNASSPPKLTPSASSSRNTSPQHKTSVTSLPKPSSSRSGSAAATPSRVHSPGPPSAGAQTGLMRGPTASPTGGTGPQTRPSQSGASLDAAPSRSSNSAAIKSPTFSATSSRQNSLSSPKQSDSDSEPPKAGREVSRGSESIARSSSPGLPPSASGTKNPRGASGLASKLETVQEGDHSSSPSDAVKGSLSSENVQDTKGTFQQVASLADLGPFSKRADETGNDHPESSLASAENPPTPTRKRSNSSLAPVKTRAGPEGSSNRMIVETEVVSSIPQTVSSNVPDRASSARGEAGTLRAKPSSDTMKPRKDRKKPVKKPPSIVSGAGSSKADIFEAKVNSEIEAEDTDSDETFVYESNPPEPHSRQSRNHSRTPSAHSVHSLADRRGGLKSVRNFNEGQRPVRNKRSMKFASNSYASSSVDDDIGDGDFSAPRPSHLRTGLGQDVHRKHPTRSGIGVNNDSPFSQASRWRNATGSSARHPGARNSPHSMTPTRLQAFSKNDDLPSEYDGGRADDEETPLLGSIRTPRTRGTRHPANSSSRSRSNYVPRRRKWSRLSCCICLLIGIVSVILGVTGFVLTTTKPLTAVRVVELQNVLASEQEMLFDLLVEATNANLVTISIEHVDLSVFAKSKFVSSDRFWRDHPHGDPFKRKELKSRGDDMRLPDPIPGPGDQGDHLIPQDGVDDGTDPIEDPEKDRQTMLIGRLFHFDSALSFDGSPLRRLPQNSTGELRLERPGNRTDVGGSERWERVVDHPFELIVRGTLKYQLPLSSKILSSSIGARAEIHPDDGVNDRGAARIAWKGG